MPRNQGTSRKGKPGRLDRAIGFGRTLQKATTSSSVHVAPKANGKSRFGDGGMQPSLPTATAENAHPHHSSKDLNTTKSVLELASVDDFLFQAELANAKFVSERYYGGSGGGGGTGGAAGGGGSGVVVIDPTSAPYRPSAVQFVEPTEEESGGSPSAPAASDAASDDRSSLFVFRELSVPRRPAWDRSTTPQQLDEREQLAFLDWRRSIARHEEALLVRSAGSQQRNAHNANRSPQISVTPFEKNLQVWRQLWRVLERSSCVLLLVDARNPLFYLSEDLREYCTADLKTPVMVVVNKSDYLTPRQRGAWRSYLKEKGWDGICFFSAFEEQRQLDAMAQNERRAAEGADALGSDGNEGDEDGDDDDDEEEEGEEQEDGEEGGSAAGENERKGSDSAPDGDSDSRNHEDDAEEDGDCPPLLSRQQLIDAMLEFASEHGCAPDPRYTTPDRSDPNLHHERIPFGLVGFPNVGKSSVINVLMGNSRRTHGTVKVGVAAQPGKTKHFQTLLLPGDSSRVVLCDCPGLVFPSFVSNTADLIASGVYPIAQMRDPYPVVSLICQRIPRNILNATYGIHIPEPHVYPSSSTSTSEGPTPTPPPPPPTAEELLDTYCHARGMLSASSGVPDVHRASRQIIRDYATGKLLYCHAPPATSKLSSTTDDGEGKPPPLRFAMTEDEYQRETLRNALRRTDKLRDKLLRQEPDKGSRRQHDDTSKGDEDGEDDNGSADGAESVNASGDDDDDQLLEFLHVSEGASSNASLASGPTAAASSHKKHYKNRRGKKKSDRSRDDDPYGCHESPDDVLARQAAAAAAALKRTGVGVKAGRYSRDAGYTRPSYSGAKGAAAAATTTSTTAPANPATTTA